MKEGVEAILPNWKPRHEYNFSPPFPFFPPVFSPSGCWLDQRINATTGLTMSPAQTRF